MGRKQHDRPASGQGAEEEIRNLEGPDGPNGFRDRTKSRDLQGCYVQFASEFASGRLGGPVLLASQRSRGQHNVWATQLADAHGGAAAGRVAAWVGDADADAVRTRWCEPADQELVVVGGLEADGRHR